MPVTYYTEAEVQEMTRPLREKNLQLSKMLAAKVSRAEFAAGIGGKGCILEPGAESEYCYGCPASELCSWEYKRWPK